MKILVTGAAGLIGSHLCDLLLNQGHKVIGIDSLLNGSLDNVPEGVDFVKWDVRDPFDVVGLDRIYHLACPASPIHYQEFPMKTMMSNIVGTYHMIGLAKKENARFLFTSSSEVYGDTKNQPINETQIGENINMHSDRSCYVEGKRAAETLIWNHLKKYNEPQVRVARLFNCYGPRMAKNDGRVIPNFIHNRPVEIHGKGNQKRSFCYVTDTVEALNLLMETEGIKRPMNIGNPAGYISIEKLALLIFKLMDEEPVYSHPMMPDADHTITHIEDRSNSEVFQRIPDISEATYLLGWSPKVGLVEGLKKTIKEIKND